jgi:hypothetical protein
MNIDDFVLKDGLFFYIDVESYNQNSDIKIEDGDVLKFNYDGIKYSGTISICGNGKTGIYQFHKIKKLS